MPVQTVIGVMDPNHYSFRAAFEGLISFLDPHIEYGGEIHHVLTRRLKSRPYNVLNARCPYAAVINRGAHWNQHFNSYLMTVSTATYQLNNMVSFNAIDKNTGFGQMARLGLKVPPTVAVPQHDYSKLMQESNVRPDLVFDVHEMFDLAEIGDFVGYPAYLKPQSGGGWKNVHRAANHAELLARYNESGDAPMNLQRAVPYREFVRTMGIGPQMIAMHYNPDADHSHDRYLRRDGRAVDFDFLTAAERDEVTKITKVINAFYGWHHNTCEALISSETGDVHPIDFCNAYPDSNLTSLHFFFPEMIKAMVRWIVFVAVTGRRGGFSFTEEWPGYLAVVREAEEKQWSYEQRLTALAQLADRHFETEKFEEFCATHLPELDRRAYEFFSSDGFFGIIREKVRRYFQYEQEHEAKYAHYAGIHRFWLHCEADRLGLAAPPV